MRPLVPPRVVRVRACRPKHPKVHARVFVTRRIVASVSRSSKDLREILVIYNRPCPSTPVAITGNFRKFPVDRGTILESSRVASVDILIEEEMQEVSFERRHF